MSGREPQLSDKFDLSCGRVLLSGTQALVRLLLEQAAADRAAGLRTAGYVTGYRGSPLGAVDMQMQRAESLLNAVNIKFAPAINEDLAATALWGSQQAELRNEGLHDGVFGLWYGKGPGVDRSGDVLRHANMAGTSRFGGVLMALGDDHTGESSTTLHQSEFALMDARMPVLSPSNVQEILDFGLAGYGMSRFSGNWVGLKCMKETVESTSVADCSSGRLVIKIPEVSMPEGGLNIRLIDSPIDQEERLFDYRARAAEAFWQSAGLDRRSIGSAGAKIGLISAGKSWLDLTHALELLGIGEAEAHATGVTAYKVGMTWPLEPSGLMAWADGLDLIIVVEEKRKIIEIQVKDLMFRRSNRPRIIGGQDESGAELFASKFALEPVGIACALGRILESEGRLADESLELLKRLQQYRKKAPGEKNAVRNPYFCSGCPHNSSTRIPEGSRAYAGIGCHYMVQWMDRNTVGFTHMGGEGANWIGEAPFTKRDHVFQNIGDGTYNHSGIMAIRAAVAADVNITYKILFNDAVAMTGGQGNDGGLTAGRVAHELAAMGLNKIVVIYDAKEGIDFASFPHGTERAERSQLDSVQQRLRGIKGVTAIIYVQTCAAEKRRRRRRGTFPQADRRIFINSDICEGCGDCGVQSNCLSVIPIDTPFGTKRTIDQSSCNADYSCLNGFCPSFASVRGGEAKKKDAGEFCVPELPEPQLPQIDGTWNVVITGVGGTGVVTVGAIISMAAFLDGKGTAMIEMAGLAQKGGAVCIHCRVAEKQSDISAVRVSAGEADSIIGGDLVVAASHEVLKTARSGRTSACVNDHEVIVGEFTRNPDARPSADQMKKSLNEACGSPASYLDAFLLSEAALGDSIYSNMIVLGFAWQSGGLPISAASLSKAIELNGVSVGPNLTAFHLGRWAAQSPDEVRVLIDTKDLQAKQRDWDPDLMRERHLINHTGPNLAQRWRQMLERIAHPEIRAAAAEGYHKLLAIKDEYEVARLHLETAERARSEFGDGISVSFHLAPPIFSRVGRNGRPAKREFGSWVLLLFRLLARAKGIRNTALDPFRFGRERRLHAGLLRTYENDMEEVLSGLGSHNVQAAVELARLPMAIKGFGPVWEENYEAAMVRRKRLLADFRAAPGQDGQRSDLEKRPVRVSG